jgi:N-formylglutamate deformylase
MNEPAQVHDSFTLYRGTKPLLVSVPHAGIKIPDDLKPLFCDRALQVEDTDWLLEQIYSFATALGASLLIPNYSRYVIDLNRPPENTPMYAGVNNTELCPTHFFSGDALYQHRCEPTPEQVQGRVIKYWQPYHQALQTELNRITTRHGHAVLWDGHSIRSQLPWLFEGRLPELNFGTVSGASCAASFSSAIRSQAQQQVQYQFVFDGRFKGGYITRRYGMPLEGVHAIQLEMIWDCYMKEQRPFCIDPIRANRLIPVLQSLLTIAIEWAPS